MECGSWWLWECRILQRTILRFNFQIWIWFRVMARMGLRCPKNHSGSYKSRSRNRMGMTRRPKGMSIPSGKQAIGFHLGIKIRPTAVESFVIPNHCENMCENTFVRCFYDDFVVEDIIRFVERVSGAGKTAYPAKRSVEAKIISESYTKARKQYLGLEVISSSGYEPIEPGAVIRRSASSLCRGPVLRMKWDDEWARILGLGKRQMKNVEERCFLEFVQHQWTM